MKADILSVDCMRMRLKESVLKKCYMIQSKESSIYRLPTDNAYISQRSPWRECEVATFLI